MILPSEITSLAERPLCLGHQHVYEKKSSWSIEYNRSQMYTSISIIVHGVIVADTNRP